MDKEAKRIFSAGGDALKAEKIKSARGAIAYAEKLSDFVKKIPHLGDAAIWALPKVGFLSSRKVRSLAVCNRFVIENADRIVFSALDPKGELARRLARVRPLEWRWL